MSSYRQILYHLVFRTKYSYKTLNPIYAKELYAYVSGFVKNKNCVLYRINGVENHLHILCDLHPSIALADFIRDLKTSTSIWLKQSGKFHDFQGWAEGYAAPKELRLCHSQVRGLHPRLLKSGPCRALHQALMALINQDELIKLRIINYLFSFYRLSI
ncbi:MAG: transposase [Bacteroidetes bacterium]|nr:transposase [Bacteroidota bacterium]